jgi:hypothetical protein
VVEGDDANKDDIKNKKEDFFFFSFFMYVIQHCFICRPSDSTVPVEAGIDPGLLRLGH